MYTQLFRFLAEKPDDDKKPFPRKETGLANKPVSTYLIGMKTQEISALSS